MVEVGELQRVADEEDRRVVADQVPVAFFGIELQREAADVALGVSRAALAGDRREAGEHRGLLADFGEDLRLGVAGDVVGDGERAERAGALGVHAPFGDHLAVEVGHLLQKPDVLQQGRPARSRGDGVVVVDDRCAGRVGGVGLVHGLAKYWIERGLRLGRAPSDFLGAALRTIEIL